MFPLKKQVLFLLGTFLLLGVTVHTHDDSQSKCGPGLNTRGWTYPRGDVVQQEGSDLSIYCFLDSKNPNNTDYTANDIYFKNASDRINSAHVKIVNQTTAQLFIGNMTETKGLFFCMLHKNRKDESSSKDDEPICLNSVVIGSKPKNVSDFSCISENWERLNCTWTVPYNTMKTNYTISYNTLSRASRNITYGCPTHEDGKCIWTLKSDPSYRRPHEYLVFKIIGWNKFGTNEQSFKIHHFAHIIPAAPKELKALNKTVSSIYLQWNVEPLHIYEGDLIYKIKYIWDSSAFWNVTIYQKGEVDRDSNLISVNVTHLPYPNTAYDFRVYVKTSLSNEKSWSEPASIIVKTKSCPPYRSPETDVGSFHINHERPENRDVMVYWKQMPPEEQNGDDFHYTITVFEGDKQINVEPISMADSYAKYSGLSFNNYRFTIRAVNAEGAAENASTVNLPHKDEILTEPLAFSKVDYGNGIYELSWEKPPIKKVITSYTVFWCESYRDIPGPCEGNIDWKRLNDSTVKYNFTAYKNQGYQFALSANTHTSSSGMIWTKCTVLHDKLVKMKTVWVHKIGTYYIYVKWKLDCSERVEGVDGYYVYYCQVNETNLNKCVGKEETYIVYGNLSTTYANVSVLYPYKFYKMAVAMFTKDKKVGPRSDEMINRTADGPPDTKGMKIDVTNITSHSALVRWSPPSIPNGVIDHYEIHYNDEVKIVKETEIILNGLNSYSQYKIRVVACTSFCSKTEPVAMHTKIGTPGVVDKPSAETFNTTHTMLTWNPPTHLAGPKPSYEVKVEFVESEKIAKEEIYETSETNHLITSPSCKSDSPYHTYTFYVRAKNVDDSDFNNHQVYYGNWSPAYAFGCTEHAGISPLWKILIIITSIVMCLVIVLLTIKKMLNVYKKMNTFNIIVPFKFVSPNAIIDEKKESIYEVYKWSDLSGTTRLEMSPERDQCSLDYINDKEDECKTSRSSSGICME